VTAPLSDARLTEIRARLAAATPGPWHVFRDSIVASAWVNRGDDPICEVVTDANDRSPDQGDTDARLIANAPTDLADLLAEVQRLRAVDEAAAAIVAADPDDEDYDTLTLYVDLEAAVRAWREADNA